MKILLTGARSMATLDLARHLHLGGHTIVTCDTEQAPITRFSKAVSKHLRIPSPRFETEAFNRRLVEITQAEGIDLLIPNWEETLYISRILDRFPPTCEVFCDPFLQLNRLHHKYQFINLLQELGFETPETHLVRTQADLQKLSFQTPYALKAAYCRGSAALFKVYPWEPIPKIEILEENPWVAQEWIEGGRFCTYSVCREGRVLAHTAYPVEFARKGQFAVTFTAINHPEIAKWVKKFVATTQHTGQIAFDFVETDNHTLYAIECNPRITSGVHLFRPPDQLHRAFTDRPDTLIRATPGTRQQIVPGMLMFGWRGTRSIKEFFQYLKRLCTVRDTIVRLDDPMPMTLAPFLFSWYWLKSRRMGLSMATKFSYDVEWSRDGDPPSQERLAQP